MSDNIHGRMVYSFMKRMWHNLTDPSSVPMTAVRIIKERFGGGFPVYKRPLTTRLNGEDVETGYYSIVRGSSPYDQKEVIFGVCTDRYNPLQPIDVAEAFDKNVGEYAETMAFLGQGEEMFISWVLPKLNIAGREEVEMYGILRGGFDTLKAYRLFTSMYRPVCANTVNWAEGWAEKNGTVAYRGKGTNKNLLEHLGYWMAHVQNNAIRESNTLHRFFNKMANTPIRHESQVKNILSDAFPLKQDVSASYPPQLRDAKAEQIEIFNNGQLELQNGIYRLFDGEGTEITQDYWGVYNATSEFFCHVQPSKRPIAESVMFGARQQNTMRVVNVMAKDLKNVA